MAGTTSPIYGAQLDEAQYYVLVGLTIIQVSSQASKPIYSDYHRNWCSRFVSRTSPDVVVAHLSVIASWQLSSARAFTSEA